MKSESVGIAKSNRQNLDAVAVRRNPQKALVPRHRVKPPLFIALQTANEIVSARRSREGIAETFVKVGLAVLIQIMQTRNLVTAKYEDTVPIDEQSQWLVQT